MDLFEEVQALGRKCKSVSDKITSEEATKNTLVMPFIKMLGYDPLVHLKNPWGVASLSGGTKYILG